ncbi:MAG: DUF5687 family protein [Prevotella sp.]
MTKELYKRLNELFKAYQILYNHKLTASKRAIDYKENRYAKWFLYIGLFFLFAYICLLSVGLSFIKKQIIEVNEMVFFFGLLPIFSLIDFLGRLLIKQSESHLIRPYLLSPLRRKDIILSFILQSIPKFRDKIFFACAIPYGFISILPTHGVAILILFLLSFYLFIVLNSIWYNLFHSLFNHNVLFFFIPICAYLGTLSVGLLNQNNVIIQFIQFYGIVGSIFLAHPICFILLQILILCIIIAIYFKVDFYLFETQLTQDKSKRTRFTGSTSAFSSDTSLRHFIQLELFQIQRNKNPRKAITLSIFLSVIFALLSVLPQDTDYGFQQYFYISYALFIIGFRNLSTTMSYEGNYSSVIFSYKDFIYQHMRAKYILNTIMLLIPITILLIATRWNNISIAFIIGYALFTAGVQYFFVLLLTLFNKQIIELNNKNTTGGWKNANHVLVIVVILLFIIPSLFVTTLQKNASETTTEIILTIGGLIFITTHKFWIRAISNRINNSHYTFIEGFNASR